MGNTKKVGITGRYGPRYGSRIRKRVKDIEEKMHTPQKCPKCETKVAKRSSTGIWTCKKCGAVFTGGSYTMKTQPGVESKRIATRVQRELEEISKE
ncbi:MAG: 50S ribosomal protein L37Ae [archaeon]|nr:50S ribosomal protein L37Ae [archaeon]